MPETTNVTPAPTVAVRYRGRFEQIGIYFGKFIRMLIYQNDWKVLPMAALIAGLVALVMSSGMFLSMEGTLMGCFAMVMVCIWNGCFNSIQVICRERDIIKREHRSGMHISAYIIAHMLYQAILCLLQTIITLYVTRVLGIRYDLCEPLFSRWALLDFGVSMFLITYAADMMSLWISSMVRSTTTAMTIMPFLLIVQLVFSGGMFTLPSWTEPMTKLAISSYGVNVLSAQGDYNHRPLVALWNRVQSMGDKELSGSVTMEQLLDYLQSDSPTARGIRETEISTSITVGQVLDLLHNENDPQIKQLRDIVLTANVADAGAVLDSSALDAAQSLLGGPASALIGLLNGSVLPTAQVGGNATVSFTVGQLVDMADESGMFDEYRNEVLPLKTTVGELVDFMQSDNGPQQLKEKVFPIRFTVAELQSMIGVERVRVALQETAAAGNVNPKYEHSRINVAAGWISLMLFVLGFAALATITLEFIDKDKR